MHSAALPPEMEEDANVKSSTVPLRYPNSGAFTLNLLIFENSGRLVGPPLQAPSPVILWPSPR